MVRHKKWKMCSRRATQNIEYYALNGHSPRFESASTVYVWGYHMLEAKLIYIKMEIIYINVIRINVLYIQVFILSIFIYIALYSNQIQNEEYNLHTLQNLSLHAL